MVNKKSNNILHSIKCGQKIERYYLQVLHRKKLIRYLLMTIISQNIELDVDSVNCIEEFLKNKSDYIDLLNTFKTNLLLKQI